MPTATDYITKIKVNLNRVQNPALLIICCVTLGSHLTFLSPSFPTYKIGNHWLTSGYQRVTTIPSELWEPVKCLPHQGGSKNVGFLPTLPLQPLPPLSPQEACLSISGEVVKKSFPNILRQWTPFTECLLNARLCKELYLYYLWSSLNPKRIHTDRQTRALKAGSAARLSGTHCLCHPEPVTWPLWARVITHFSFGRMIKVFTSSVCWRD